MFFKTMRTPQPSSVRKEPKIQHIEVLAAGVVYPFSRVIDGVNHSSISFEIVSTLRKSLVWKLSDALSSFKVM